MSLHDSIRDELYGPAEGGAADEAASFVADEILESASYPHSAFKVLAIAIAAEIGLAAMFLLAGDRVGDLFADETFLYVAAAIFVTGFLIAFTTFRMFEHSWGTGRRPGSPSLSIVSGPAPRPYSGGIWIWFLSTAAGVLNIILFYLILSLN